MKQLEKVIRDNFDIDDETETHLNSILIELLAEIDQNIYDDDFGRVSHDSICEAFDNKLYDILSSKTA